MQTRYSLLMLGLAIMTAINICTKPDDLPPQPRQVIETDSTAHSAGQTTMIALPCNRCGTFINAAFVYEGEDVVVLCQCGNRLVYSGSAR